MTDATNTSEKGDRNEREAANILARVYGKSNVDKVYRYAGNDPFGLADVMGMKADWPLRVVQVKTNSFTAADRRKYRRNLRDFPHEYAVFEVWVRVDYEGWRMHRYDPDTDEFNEFLHMDTCDTEATVEAFREAVGYYDAIDDG